MKTHVLGVLAPLLLVCLAAASCAEANSLGDGRDAGLTGPSFDIDSGTGNPREAGSAPLDTNLCASTTCTEPFTTCGDSKFPCDVDLSNDVNNCGRCGFACPPDYTVSMKFTCSEGRCIPAGCGTNAVGVPLADCDGFLDNGCEVTLGNTTDSENCSACGDKCAPGVNCIFEYSTYTSHCGCAAPLKDCTNGVKCSDPRKDDANCGACGNACADPPAGASPAPPNSHYGCSDSTCGHLKCDQSPPYYVFEDCNKDLNSKVSDGCEVDLMTPNDDNCGACGNKCAAGKHCFLDFNAGPLCACPSGQRFCDATLSCTDTSNDPLNCGGCGVACPGPADPTLLHGGATCKGGQCGFECQDGFADCNGDLRDGCEVDLHADPSNCGACGATCSGDARQPCIGGKCAVEPCGGVK